MDERPGRYAGFGMGTHLAILLLGLALIDHTSPERRHFHIAISHEVNYGIGSLCIARRGAAWPISLWR